MACGGPSGSGTGGQRTHLCALCLGGVEPAAVPWFWRRAVWVLQALGNAASSRGPGGSQTGCGLPCGGVHSWQEGLCCRVSLALRRRRTPHCSVCPHASCPKSNQPSLHPRWVPRYLLPGCPVVSQLVRKTHFLQDCCFLPLWTVSYLCHNSPHSREVEKARVIESRARTTP